MIFLYFPHLISSDYIQVMSYWHARFTHTTTRGVVRAATPNRKIFSHIYPDELASQTHG